MSGSKIKFADINLVEYLESIGEPLVREGHKYYRHKEHDSLLINTEKNVFYWNSKGVGGSVISYLENVHDLTREKAIEKLKVDMGVNPVSTFVYKEPEYPVEFDYTVNEVNSVKNMKRYLVDERRLDVDVIDELISKDFLAEDSRGNVVFKWKNEGKVVGASLQGTREIPLDKRLNPKRTHFKSILPTTKEFTDYGFNVSKGIPKHLYFFEAPIDMLSYLSLNKELDDYWMIAIDGVKMKSINDSGRTVMKKLIDEGYEAESLNICCDNDKAGIELVRKLKKFAVTMPSGKELSFEAVIPRKPKGLEKWDWNNELIKQLDEKVLSQKREVDNVLNEVKENSNTRLNDYEERHIQNSLKRAYETEYHNDYGSYDEFYLYKNSEKLSEYIHQSKDIKIALSPELIRKNVVFSAGQHRSFNSEFNEFFKNDFEQAIKLVATGDVARDGDVSDYALSVSTLSAEYKKIATLMKRAEVMEEPTFPKFEAKKLAYLMDGFVNHCDKMLIEHIAGMHINPNISHREANEIEKEDKAASNVIISSMTYFKDDVKKKSSAVAMVKYGDMTLRSININEVNGEPKIKWPQSKATNENMYPVYHFKTSSGHKAIIEDALLKNYQDLKNAIVTSEQTRVFKGTGEMISNKGVSIPINLTDNVPKIKDDKLFVTAQGNAKFSLEYGAVTVFNVYKNQKDNADKAMISMPYRKTQKGDFENYVTCNKDLREEVLAIVKKQEELQKEVGLDKSKDNLDRM